MEQTGRAMRWSRVTAVAAAIWMALALPAAAEMTADQVAALIAERYGVKVLRVVTAVDAERAVYRVTVMRGGGNSNSAYQVTTIAVDAESGELVRQFRHLSSGYALSGAPSHGGDIKRPDAAQNGVVWR